MTNVRCECSLIVRIEARQAALAGCIDVDIGITPATNTLELEIDEAGLVLDYPEMFRRIAVAR
jgi:hypothetical protein